MGIREKLIARVQPLLPGENIQQVFLAQAGASPWIGNSFGFLGQSVVRRRIVAVTDHAVVVFGADFNGTKPTELLRRLPRGTKLGPTRASGAGSSSAVTRRPGCTPSSARTSKPPTASWRTSRRSR